MKDVLVRAVTADGHFRIAVARTTALVNDACLRQQTDPTASVAFGRLLSGGALLSCLLKGNQRLALMVEGNGPLGKMTVEADAGGCLRGSVVNPLPGLPPKDDQFDVAGAIGRAGFLHVWKDLGLKEPYQSMVQLQTSEIGEDLAWYLTHSEQVPSSLGLAVELGTDAAVVAAGGFLIQALPPQDEEQIEALIPRIQQLPPVTALLRQGVQPLELIRQLFPAEELALQVETPLVYSCPCTRSQIEQMLLGLGTTELTVLMDEALPVEVVCEYCRTAYRFDEQQMRTLIAESQLNSGQ